MSNASGAHWLREALGPSRVAHTLEKIWGAKRFLMAALGIWFSVGTAFAAPYSYVVNYTDSTVSVIDQSTNKVVTTVPTRVAATTTDPAKPGIGVNPVGIAINPAGTRVYVVNFGDSTDTKTPGTVSVIDSTNPAAANPAIVTTITVGIRPQIIAINPAGTTAYVTNTVDNTLSAINLATNTVTATIKVGGYPVGVAFTPDGTKAYVTLADKSRVAVIDAVNNAALSTIALSYSNPIGIVIDPAGKFAYVSDYAFGDYGQKGAVSVIDLAAGVETTAIPVGAGPNAIAISSDGVTVYVANYYDGTLSLISTATKAVTALVGIGINPSGISLDSTGTYAYVSIAGGGSVAIVDLSVNVARGPIGVGQTPLYSVTTSSANMTVNLDQRGLTGSWYNQSASGQGILLESMPDVKGAGNGTLFGGWFTYDVTAAGGQRWYSLQGDVTSTDLVANLTIYAGTGGNFNAGPVVSPVAVGQAKLRFVDCTHGILSYTFNDGRQGFTTLNRLTGGATCTPTGDSGSPAAGDQYSGSWYNPDTSGQGLVLNTYSTAQGSFLFGGWFTYAQNGQQTGGGASQNWFSLQSPSTQPAVGNSYTVNINAGSGGIFVNPLAVTTTQVGTATVTFPTCTTMTLTYSFTAGANKGLGGTLNLVRLGQPPTGCQ
ncbi:MAG: YncE family protein [Rudaea sp.]|uniref:YncE family protein n=1 Tax=unclassified Rudaea TaxID=2627037 RepID=UPI0010F83EFA|nr:MULTISPECIES: YncE family protein [unclassified Rudaea]MBN8886745.1 YncE family protein [Rudaea sp.]